MIGVLQLLNLNHQGACADKFPAILLYMNAIEAQQWSPRENREHELTVASLAVAAGEHLTAAWLHDLTPPPVMLAPTEAAQNSFA